MMATIGTVNVKVVPEIDLESVGTQAFIEAVAAAVVEKLSNGRLECQHKEPEAWGIERAEQILRGRS